MPEIPRDTIGTGKSLEGTFQCIPGVGAGTGFLSVRCVKGGLDIDIGSSSGANIL